MYMHSVMKESSQCTCTNLRRATGAVTQYYDKALAASGLRVTQFSLLRTLSRLQSVSITRLSEEMRLDRTTLGRNLKILQRARLVVLVPGEDLREREVMLSPSGTQALRAAIPLWERAQKQVGRWLGAKDLYKLSSLLSVLESNAT